MPITQIEDFVPMLAVSGRRSNRWPKSNELKGRFTHQTQVPAQYTKCWHIACTKSQHDRALVRELIGKKTTVFLPIETIQVQSANALHTGQRPVLPGYVFFHCAVDSSIIQDVKESDHTFDILKFKGQAQYYLEVDLKRIWLCMCDVEKTTHNNHQINAPAPASAQRPRCMWLPIKPGTDCIIMKGRMAGEHATVIEQTDDNTVTLQVPIRNLGGAYTFQLPRNSVQICPN